MTPPAGSSWRLVAACDAIPLREGRRVRYGNTEIARFNLGGTFAAVANHCPHRQGPLADGIVAGKSVFCPLHAWKVCLDTGTVIGGGEGRVSTYPVKVVDQHVYVAFEDAQSSTQEPSPCP